MKYFTLNKDEQELVDALEKNDFFEIPELAKEKSRFEKIAQASLNKNRNINIRVTEGDFQKLKAAALEEGIPYQTLISSLIHKFTRKKLSLD